MGARPGLAALVALAACNEPPYGPALPTPGAAGAQTVPFTLGPVQACDDPLDAVRYTEVGEAMGLTVDDAGAAHAESGHVVVEDLDLDGDLDILLTYAWQGGPTTLYLREGAGFSPETVDLPGRVWAPTLVDIDGDGVDDVLFGIGGAALLRREGGLVGARLAVEPPSILGARTVREFVAGDFDNDGLDDLYAVCTGPDSGAEGAGDFILWAEPGGTFRVDDGAMDPELSRRLGFDGLAIDMDADGWLDVCVDNDKGGPNTVLYNRGGVLEDAGDESGCAFSHAGMGVDAADFNADGAPDFYLSGTERNVLLVSDAQGRWVDATHVAAADPLERVGEVIAMTWGAVWLDHDNDGQLDVLVAEGDLWGAQSGGDAPRVADMPINLLRSEGGVFTDVAAPLGLSQAGSFRAVVAQDHNGDGVLDLLVTQVADRPLLYVSDGCTAPGWLEVRAPRGARVDVTAGGRTWTDWVMSDSGWGAAQPPNVHFGLGEAEEIDALVVTLPGGRVLAADTPFAARRRVWTPTP